MKTLFKSLIFISIIFGSTLHAEILPDDSIYQVKSEWTNQDGKKINISDFKGHPVVISMVYMTCKFSCPLTVNYMKDIEKNLPKDLKGKVQFVLVSFDPDRDTPEKMKEFAAKYKLTMPPWHFITNPREQNIREMSVLLDFKYKKIEGGEFEHSFSIAAFDKNGVVTGKLDGVELKPIDLIPLLQGKNK